MNKIIFITGATGSGKSTYIQNRFADSEKVYVFDMALQSMKLFGNYNAIDEDDLIVDIYNSLTEEAMFALLDDFDLVVEYCTDGYDDDLFAIVKEARKMNINTEIIHLTADAIEAEKRMLGVENNIEYYPSKNYKEDSLLILSGVMETYVLNRGFEVVCEMASEEKSIKLFRIGREERDQFFYMSSETDSFDFEPQFEFEKSTGVNYVKEFDKFDDAFESLQQEYSIFSLSPIKIDTKYIHQFRDAYQKLLKDKDNIISHTAWGQFMN